MHYFLRNFDPTAARQLIFICEQNNVRAQLEPAEQKVYARLFDREEKLNYELNLGARKFKCTTIPIIRKEYGVVGAICVNVDANYLTEEVLNDSEKVANFFQTFCRTDIQLDENILSRDEYAKALKGKRHFKDNRFE